MKKIKIAACSVMAVMGTFMLAGCEAPAKVFDIDDITITNAVVEYNGQSQVFDIAYPGVDFEVAYSLDGQQFVPANQLNLKNAGDYEVYFKLSADGYQDYISNIVDMTIDKKEIEITTIDAEVLRKEAGGEIDSNKIGWRITKGATAFNEGLDFDFVLKDYDVNNVEIGDTFEVDVVEAEGSNYDITVANGATAKIIDNFTLIRNGSMSYFSNIEDALESAQAKDVLVLNTDIKVYHGFYIDKEITIDGQNQYKISPVTSGSFTGIMANNDMTLFALNSEDAKLTLKDLEIDCKSISRAVSAYAGQVTIENTTIHSGKKVDDRKSGAIYMDGNSKLIMNSGLIRNNDADANDHFAYAGDVWVGEQAEAVLKGGVVGKVFVNALSGLDGELEVNGCNVNNVYLQADDVYGAECEFKSGRIGNFMIATGNTVGEYTVISNIQRGVTYTGSNLITAFVDGEKEFYSTLEDAIEDADENSEITLFKNITLNETLLINKSLTINGQNEYKITASEDFTDTNLILVDSNVSVTLKKLTVDANQKCRVAKFSAGSLLVNNSHLKNGYLTDNYASGVFITGKASFSMNGGSILNNSVDANYEDADKYYVVNSQDLWIGSEANGAFITGGKVGKVFVNANSYSLSTCILTLTAGEVESIYVEYDKVEDKGASFRYIDGTVGKLVVSNADAIPQQVSLSKGTTYVGGEQA